VSEIGNACLLACLLERNSSKEDGGANQCGCQFGVSLEGIGSPDFTATCETDQAGRPSSSLTPGAGSCAST